MTATAAEELLPALPGAYELFVELSGPLEMIFRGRPLKLPAGRYVYCGSARGPGGMAARVARHRKREKSVRWHIDRLTTVAPVVGAAEFPGGNECALVASWLGRGAHAVVPGFGSSDCRHCTAHLLLLPSGLGRCG